jgi:outer membrane protein TolC
MRVSLYFTVIALVTMTSAFAFAQVVTQEPARRTDVTATAAPNATGRNDSMVSATGTSGPALQPSAQSNTVQSAIAVPADPANDLPEVLRPRSGGLTADQAAARAVRVNLGVAASRAGLRVAELQQAESGWAMLPTLSVSARYTRLSDITPGTIPFFNTPGCLMAIAQCQANPNAFIQNVVLQQPILNNIAFRISLTVPVTDIPFRLREFYLAAGHSAEARRLDLDVQRNNAALQGREAYYEYVRALGSVAAAEAALALTRRRREDIVQLRSAGMVAPSELTAVDSAVASAELRLTQARNLLSLMDLQLRQRLRLSPTEPVVLSEGLTDPLPLPNETLAELVTSALHSRPEVQSIERQLRALDAQQRATVAGLFPSVAVVGNVDISNPNQRIFPQREGEFIATWDLTVQAQWTPNQLISGLTANARLDAQRAQIQAQLAQLRDGLEAEVRAQYNALLGAQDSIVAARAALAAAKETYRVRRERLSAGASTQTDVADAETQLFNAQINLLNAYVDLRLSAARLRRAAGIADPAMRDPSVASR